MECFKLEGSVVVKEIASDTNHWGTVRPGFIEIGF